MSLDRQDVRSRLDSEKHKALVAICEAKGITVADFVETLLVPEIDRLVHETKVIAERLELIPAAGNNRDEVRQPGNGGSR